MNVIPFDHFVTRIITAFACDINTLDAHFVKLIFFPLVHSW